jgi:formylglycine-generating enzyme
LSQFYFLTTFMKKILFHVLITLCALSAITCKSRDFSNPVDMSVLLPAPRTLVVTTLTENGADLSWQADPADPKYSNAPIRILIERSSNGINYSLVDSVDGDVTAHTIAGIYRADTTYAFRVRVRAEQNISPYSNTATSRFGFAAPSGLAIGTISETSIGLQWVDNSSSETGFLIERSSDGAPFAIVDSTAANITVKTVAGAYRPGITYTFRVRAKSIHLTSGYSNAAPAVCVLAAPTSLTVKAMTAVSASLQWTDNSTFETGFLIERSTDGTNFSVIDSTGPNGTTKDIAGVYQPDTTYSFRVRAVSLYHTSANSNVAARSLFVRDVLMVRAGGGTFQMGSAFGSTDEQPAHSVMLSSFYIDRYEITYEKWTSVRTWALTHGYTDLVTGQNGSSGSGTNNPVTNVNWYDILKWCNARSEMDGLAPMYYTGNTFVTVYRTGDLAVTSDAVKWSANGYRLPTEAEWEFAARGGTTTHNYSYSGSNILDDVGWYSTNAANATHTVGGKLANELGIYDLSGNVEERCWDWYGAYAGGAQTDPTGASTGSYRVLRGGSFNDLTDPGFDCRVSYRDNSGPGVRVNNFGFRCVQR